MLVKNLIIIALMVLPCSVNAQTSDIIADSSFRYFLQAGSIQSQINNAEKEVKAYDKEIKQNIRLQNRMKDKEGRLKYRVARQLAKMDTIGGHKTTYLEWQLIKTRKAIDQANLHIVNAEHSRQEKILLLADKTKEFDAVMMKSALVMATQRIEANKNNEKGKAGQPKKKVKSGQNYWR